MSHLVRPGARVVSWGRRSRVPMALFVIASALLFLLNTRHGIGILPDSVAYMRLGNARHFAPLYTWLLQAVSWPGIDIVSAAKWLGLGLVVVNTMLVWRLLLGATASLASAAVGTALVVFSPVFVQMHAVAMTEPLFLALFLCSLLLFLRGMDDQRRIWFGLAGALLGATMLARFAAAPIVAAFCLCRMLDRTRPLGQRLLDCMVLGLAAVAVFAAWVSISELTSGQSTGRAFAFRGDPDVAEWLAGINSMSIMLLPSPVPAVARMAFLAFALATVLWASAPYVWRWIRGDMEDRSGWASLPVVCALFILAYAGLMVLTMYIQAYNVPLDGRTQLPAYVAAVIMTTVSVGRQGTRGRVPTALALALWGLALVILLGSGPRVAKLTAESFSEGIGYTERKWADSPTLRAVAALPGDAFVYSNAPDVIVFRLGRQAEYLPSRFNHVTGLDDPERPFEEQIADMRDRLRHTETYVAILDDVDWRFYLIPERDLLEAVSLSPVVTATDGRVYKGVR